MKNLAAHDPNGVAIYVYPTYKPDQWLLSTTSPNDLARRDWLCDVSFRTREEAVCAAQAAAAKFAVGSQEFAEALTQFRA
jgi:hypothetical protein